MMNNYYRVLCKLFQLTSVAVAVMSGMSVMAQSAPVIIDNPTSSAGGAILHPQAGERLGDVLAHYESQATSSSLNTEALMWQRAGERSVQAQHHARVRDQLEQLAQQPDGRAIQPFVTWFSQLPITGRVILPAQDPHYLQVNPHLNPVMEQGDTVVIPEHQAMVTVLFDDATTCRVKYHAGVNVQGYLKSCSQPFDADVGYLILPNGTVETVSLAKWNAKQQSVPVAGAWLWIPNPAHGWQNTLALEVAQFIATQGIDLALPQGQGQTVAPISSVETTQSTRDLPISSSNWGVMGLLQTPTARMQSAGYAGVQVSHTDPYTRYNIVLQPFDRVETAIRYVNIDGVSYGVISPDQDYKDKSLDIKLNVWKESRFLPEVAVGWRDPLGTGLFGGEYIVANKRYADFDFSLGLGWGYLGSRADIDNPLSLVDSRFKRRQQMDVGEGGTLSPKTWFTGKMALFGGVQWHSPYQPLTVKLEYDGNTEVVNPRLKTTGEDDKLPVNLGVTWQKKGVEVSAGVERGDTMMIGLALHGDLSKLGQFKPTEKASSISSSRSAQLSSQLERKISFAPEQAEEKNTDILQAFTEATGWQAYELSEGKHNILIKVEDDGGLYTQDRVHNAVNVLKQLSIEHGKLMQIQLNQQGEAVNVLNIDLEKWDQQHQQWIAPSQRSTEDVAVKTGPAKPSPVHSDHEVLAKANRSKGQVVFSPSLYQSIGGPDGYLFGIYANANASYRLGAGTWLNALAQFRLVDNFDQYTYTSESQLPHVRTNIREYMTTSRILMPNLQWTQFKSLGSNVYRLAYAGYLDPMFAGIGGEILYREADSNWAIGADLNHVYQRDFAQHFELENYHVTTGHVNVYWDTPWYDIGMKLSAGQYLAGDKGVTLDVSRSFRNGVKMGAWATKTDVSAAQFGEGSLDKGIYVSIPFDALFSKWSSGYATMMYQPLIRDGGAKLNRMYNLHDMTSKLDSKALEVENPWTVK